MLAANPVAHLLRRLRYQTNLGHSQGLTQVRAGTCWQEGNEPVETTDNVVLTCSKDGTVGVWTHEESGFFQILCFLVHVSKEQQVVKVNDAAACVLGNRLHVLTGAADGYTRFWTFTRGEHAHPPYERFADQEDLHGIAQRLVPECEVAHECAECKTNHAVLSLAVLPRNAEQRTNAVFNFVAGTAMGLAQVYSVVEAEEGFSIARVRERGRSMLHARESVVQQVTVAGDFLRGGRGLLIATCDTLGLAKLWRLNDITRSADGDTCSIDHLRTFVHRDGSRPYNLRCVMFTPAFQLTDSKEAAPRYLVTSSFDILQQHRSRVFAWGLEEVMDVKNSARMKRRPSYSKPTDGTIVNNAEAKEVCDSEPKRIYVFRANNLAFWYLRDTGAAITTSGMVHERVEPYIYCLTSAPDNSAKMFKLINMKTGTLTFPLLRDQVERTVKRTDLGAVDQTDTAAIVRIFRHTQPVQAVLLVRMGSEAADGASGSGALPEESSEPRLASKGGDRSGTPRAVGYVPLGAPLGTGGQQQQQSCAWYVLTASEDRVATVWDPITGQCVHALRAATMQQMYLPLLVQVITSCQLVAFSLDGCFHWNRRMVTVPYHISSLLTLDLTLLSRFSHVPLPEDALFLGKLALSVLSMLVFIVTVASNVLGREARRTNEIEVSERYRREVKFGQTGLTSKAMGFAHREHRRSMTRIRLWMQVIWACTMVLVVPMAKSITRFFDCNTDPDHDPPYYLNRVPWLACYRGAHLFLAPPLGVLLPVFMFLVLPFRVVKGDAAVVAYEDLLNPRQWQRNAIQKHSQADMGPMQTHPFNYFYASVVEIFAKVAAPVCSIMLTSRVITKASALAGIHLMVVVSGMIRPTHVVRSINTLFMGVKFIALWVAACSILAVAGYETGTVSSTHAAWLMYAGCALISAVVVCLYSWQHSLEYHEEQVERALMHRLRPQKTMRSLEEQEEEEEEGAEAEATVWFGFSDMCLV